MRIAFEIKAIAPEGCTLHLYDGKGLLAGAVPVVMTWLRNGADAKVWERNPSYHISGLNSDGLTIARLVGARMEKFCLENKTSLQDHPLAVAQMLLAYGGSQTVWDKRLSKFRTVGLMKDGINKFELVGIDMEVEADDEETAKKRGRREVALAMAEEPERAEALAKWFSSGCKVKKSVDAKMPDVFTVAQLAANNAVEKAQAEKPITRRRGAKGEEA